MQTVLFLYVIGSIWSGGSNTFIATITSQVLPNPESCVSLGRAVQHDFEDQNTQVKFSCLPYNTMIVGAPK